MTTWIKATALAIALATSAQADTQILPAIPGTEIPDMTATPMIERDGVVRPVIPGTHIPDYGSQERHIIRDGRLYDAIPGTMTPDATTGQPLIQR